MNTFQGVVIHGKKLGRTIGFPTCNLQVEQHVALSNGVYGVEVTIADEKYVGVMNIGTRPTINDGDAQSVEVHILNFNQDVYGEQLVVIPVHFIRQEQKFNGLDALIDQLHQDVATMRQHIQLAV